jgi:periplasmic divalent cation tolerance protein
MIIKTRASLLSKLEVRVKEPHSYEVPEVIALPIVTGAKSYLDWIIASTSAKPRGAATRRRPPRGKQ